MVIKISSDWTDKERLEAVMQIAAELSRHPMYRMDRQLQDIVDRLSFVAGADKEFLEMNRDKIIGQEQTKC